MRAVHLELQSGPPLIVSLLRRFSSAYSVGRGGGRSLLIFHPLPPLFLPLPPLRSLSLLCKSLLNDCRLLPPRPPSSEERSEISNFGFQRRSIRRKSTAVRACVAQGGTSPSSSILCFQVRPGLGSRKERAIFDGKVVQKKFSHLIQAPLPFAPPPPPPDSWGIGRKKG